MPAPDGATLAPLVSSSACATPPAPVGPSAPGADTLTVCFDGSCPLCRREIALYQGLAAGRGVAFVDVSAAALPLPPEMQVRPVETLPTNAGPVAPASGAASPSPSTQALMQRFHVRQSSGQWLSGAAAFVAVWQRLPGWRWLAMLARIPGVLPLMEWAYRVFLLVLRPRLQGLARRWEVRQAAAAGDAAAARQSDSSNWSVKYPRWLLQELRSDHAGETGAVRIYDGVLAVTRDPALRAFAQAHRATESKHLQALQALLPAPQRSRLLGPWRAAGWLTGALPALFGPRAVYATIAAVERFVDAHYQQQIDALAALPEHAALRDSLIAFQADECEHRDQAQAAVQAAAQPADTANAAPSWLLAPLRRAFLHAWCSGVGAGSAAAVVLARRI